MKEQLLIDKELVEALAKYLATRPYAEVAQAMSLLAQLKPAVEQKKDEPKAE